MSVNTEPGAGIPEHAYPDATEDSLCSVCGGYVLNKDGSASICRMEMRDGGDGTIEMRMLLHQPPWQNFSPPAQPPPERYYRKG